MLKLHFRDLQREAVWLAEKTFSIGKNPANSLMLEEDGIDDFHAKIINIKDTLSLINKSANKTLWVNGEQINGQRPIKAGDIITIGNIDLELVDPKFSSVSQDISQSAKDVDCWSIHSQASWLEQNRFPIKNKVVIGRDPSCDITLSLKHLSRRHVELEVRGGQLFLKDLESSNGTLLNGNLVSESRVNTGDKIKLDVVIFDVEGPVHDPNKTIIRTLPPKKSASKPLVSNSKPMEKAKPVRKNTQKTTRPPKKTKAHKQLVAQGKQDWILGDGYKDTPRKSKTRYLMVAASAILIIATAAIVSSFYLR